MKELLKRLNWVQSPQFKGQMTKAGRKLNAEHKMGLQTLGVFISNGLTTLTWRDWDRRYKEITGFDLPPNLPEPKPLFPN